MSQNEMEQVQDDPLLTEVSNQQPLRLAALPHKSSRLRIVFFVGLLLLCVFISIPLVQFFGGFFGSVPEEMARTSQVIDKYLGALARKDENAAFEVMYTSGEEPIALADIKELVSDKNYFVFQGYSAHTFTDFNLTQAGPTKYAEISGEVTYDSDNVGQYSAILVKESDA